MEREEGPPTLPEAFWQQLAKACPVPGRVTPEVVRAWFAIAWPSYSARGYKNHRRAIANWWKRVRPEELEAARERAKANELRASQRELLASAREIESAAPKRIPLAEQGRRAQ